MRGMDRISGRAGGAVRLLGLAQPVFLLSGDLHNSFVIKITDNVWEFASGPHSSGNHIVSAEGHHPLPRSVLRIHSDVCDCSGRTCRT